MGTALGSYSNTRGVQLKVFMKNILYRILHFAPSIFIILALIMPCHAQVPSPSEPVVPVINASGNIRSTLYRATLVFADGRKTRGELILPGGSVSFTCIVNGGKTQVTEALSRISSVEFKKWAGRPHRGGILFRPAETLIVTLDKRCLNCTGSSGFPDKMKFRHDNRVLNVYPVFYDYRVSGKWYNSGKAALGYPETHPLPDTLVSIIFHHKAEDALKKLLFR